METSSLQQYADALFGGEDEALREMREEAVEAGLPAINVPQALGRLLQILIVSSGAKRVLEIGTLFGYSAILMARALPSDGTILTLEVNPKHAALARGNLERAELSSRVDVREGAALDSLTSLQGQTFDLIFIDADKEGYPAYLHHALTLSHPGSVIVADNVWRQGKVLDAGEDASSAAVSRFNEALAHTDGVLTTVVPSRGGDDAATVSVVLGRRGR